MTAVLEVQEKDRKCLPIGRFVNGKVKNSDGLNSRLLVRTDTSDVRLKDQKIMVAETSHMTYTGKNFGSGTLNHVKGLMKNYVGIFDEKTGKMRICDTEVFIMQPYIPDEDTTDSTASNLDKNQKYSEKVDSLTSAFGSTRKRRAMESRQRLQVGDEELKGVLNSAIDHGLEKAKVHKQKQDEMVVDPNLASTPPCHKDATRVEDVYKLSDIITRSEIESLQHCAGEFYNCDSKQIAEWTTSKKYPNYVIHHLERMPINEEQRWHRSKCLMYLNYMIVLYNMRARELDKRFPLPGDLPLHLKQKLLDMFTMSVQVDSKSKRCLPSRLKDRLASYAITLCLLIDEFTLDLDLILKDLQLSKSKGEQHAAALGCRLVRAKEDDEKKTTTAKLQLPLKFPSKSLKMRR